MRATKFVESYFDAWNHSDPEGVADHLAADGIYTDIPENVQRSHDELITNLSEFFANYRHRYELIGDISKLKDVKTIEMAEFFNYSCGHCYRFLETSKRLRTKARSAKAKRVR